MRVLGGGLSKTLIVIEFLSSSTMFVDSYFSLSWVGHQIAYNSGIGP